jgi:glycosyltransferase involved in cell wall biosynthesis
MFGYGHGPDEDAQQYARERGIETGVEFVGQIPYAQVLARLAAEIDVLVHPSLQEAQPMVLIEAMALGIPVIGGEQSGGVPWTLGNGDAGVLVDVRDPDALTDAMLHLANNANERHDLAQRGRAFAETNFHIGVVADAYEKIYHDLRMG